jgi:siroheme synthase-like protein
MKPKLSIRKSRGTGNLQNKWNCYAETVLNFRYPVFLDLTGKRCLVTGEGYELPGKVRGLVDAGAEMVYINPTAEASIAELSAEERITWHVREFMESDLDGCFLVIADLEDNSAVFRACEHRGILCNSVDDPEHCRFTFGSLVRRGDLTVAISTNGWAPALAVRLKEHIQDQVGPEYEAFLAMLKDVRPEITRRVDDFEARKALWYRIVDSEMLAMLRAGREGEADRYLKQMIDEAASSTSHSDTSGDAADQ